MSSSSFSLSPGSLLFPFSDSSFASCSASSSSRPFSLPPPPLLPSSVSLASSSSSYLASSSVSTSLPLPPSPVFLLLLLLILSPLSPLFRLWLPFVLLLAFLLPPGFAPLTTSVSPPLPSSYFLSVSATMSFSSALPPVCVSFLAGQAAPVLSSSSSSSFTPLDFASLLGLSQDFQSLAHWCFLSGVRVSVRIFLPSILTSPLLLLVLSPLALPSSPPLFVQLPLLCLFFRCLPMLLLFLRWLLPPPLTLQLLSFRLHLSPLPLLSLLLLLSLLGCLRWVGEGGGVRGLSAIGFCSGGGSGSPGFPPFPAPSALLSVPPPAVPPSSVSPSRPPGVSVLSPPASSLLPSAPFVWPVSSAHALGSSLVVRGFHGCLRVLTLLCCTLSPVSDPPVLSAASALPPFCSAPLGSAAGPFGFASSTGSTFGPGGSAPQPGPSSVFPPLSGASAAPSAPPLSEFGYGPDVPLLLDLLIQTLPVLRLRILRL